MASRRNTLVAFLAGVILLGGGCSRRGNDPMEWKIDAATPQEWSDWVSANVPLMPPKLSDELTTCFNNIVALTPGWQSSNPNQVTNPVCQRIDGITVRSLLIDGNQIGIDDLASRIQSRSTTLITLTSRDRDLSADEQKRLQHQIEFYKDDLARLQERLEAAEKHLADLMARREPPYK